MRLTIDGRQEPGTSLSASRERVSPSDRDAFRHARVDARARPWRLPMPTAAPATRSLSSINGWRRCKLPNDEDPVGRRIG